jgi:hypothetical protein
MRLGTAPQKVSMVHFPESDAADAGLMKVGLVVQRFVSVLNLSGATIILGLESLQSGNNARFSNEGRLLHDSGC